MRAKRRRARKNRLPESAADKSKRENLGLARHAIRIIKNNTKPPAGGGKG